VRRPSVNRNLDKINDEDYGSMRRMHDKPEQSLQPWSLLGDHLLAQSPVVANSTMNRQRACFSCNSYQKELAFDPLQFLQSRLNPTETIRWLDLCCGTGRALIQAAQMLHADGLEDQVVLIGLDLVDMFATIPPELSFLQFLVTSTQQYQPAMQFDLITCVHGLHYIGDKLQLIQRACSWLTTEGVFLANLDLQNLRLGSGQRAARTVSRQFRALGIEYHARKKLIARQGGIDVEFPWHYLGADDQAGPNYTGQPVVNSYYAEPQLI
jgi:SAM-dependent methyltransferase